MNTGSCSSCEIINSIVREIVSNPGCKSCDLITVQLGGRDASSNDAYRFPDDIEKAPMPTLVNIGRHAIVFPVFGGDPKYIGEMNILTQQRDLYNLLFHTWVVVLQYMTVR